MAERAAISNKYLVINWLRIGIGTLGKFPNDWMRAPPKPPVPRRHYPSHTAMTNLLSDQPSRKEILDILGSGNLAPHLPPMGDPAWASILGNPRLRGALEALTQRALDEAGEPMPVLTDALYAEYHITGTRRGFELPYFERRRRIGRSAIALLAATPDNRPRLLASFLAKLENLFSEESWSVPAHVSAAIGKDPMCIDLFAAETAFLMAECLTVFSAVIPEDLRQRIRKRLRVCFFENYLARADSFHWTSGTSNWNAVCHQGVLGAALAAEEDRELVADVLHFAIPRLGRFLRGFAEDGGCTEGPGYWVYGFGWFCSLNEQLESQTRNRLSLFEGNDLIRRIARYAPAVSLAGGRSVNFADGASGPLAPWLLQYLGVRLGEQDCLLQASENFDLLEDRLGSAGILDGQRSDFFHWRRTFMHVPAPGLSSTRPAKPDHFLPDLGVWVVRGKDQAGHLWELAAKGGYNEEHHNHNDVGSFILNVDRQPLVTEIGAPLYVKAFFKRETRYEFLAARSLGHSLPLVNGQEQECGVEYKGTITKAETNRETVVFEADLAGAYPAAAHCHRLVRRLTLSKERGELLWEDEITCGEAVAVESALITHSPEVEILSPNLARIRQGNVELHLETGEGIAWDRIERHTYQDHQDRETVLHRLVLKPRERTCTTRFRTRLFLAVP